jgi:lysine 2,3-aminomutase
MTNSPFPSNRALFYADVPDEKWNDWKWQLSHRLKIIHLSEDERQALSMPGIFRVDVTPYFVSLMDPNDPNDPIRKQVIPTTSEFLLFEGMMEDSLAEDRHSPVPGLVHRYPDRALLLLTTQCASYCRYCTRSRLVGNPQANFSREDFEKQAAYLERTPEIRDVLLSGGDPLTLAPAVLEHILERLRQIPSIEVIRIGSRVPVFLPMRITPDLTEMLEKYHPLWMNIHINHPNEITAELAQACDRLTRAGIPLGNQSVLLAGVNDNIHIQRDLVHRLLRIRVRPYYLYQCDLVAGAGHFRTSIAKGIEIMEGLRGHTSGFAVPQYVVDAPGGGGKIPLSPNYLLSMADHKVVLRNFEGYITTYQEPTDYVSPSSPTAVNHRPERSQEGILALLEGEHLAIKPEGFDQAHNRSRFSPNTLQIPQNRALEPSQKT